MSRSISWIDERAFKQLLGRAGASRERLDPGAEKRVQRRPPASPRASPANPAFVKSSDRPSTENGAARRTHPGTFEMPPERPPGSSRPAASAAAPNPSAKKAPLREFQRPNGTMDDGATALLDWLSGELAPEECFICDKEGLALVNRKARLEYLAISAALIRALEDVEAITGEDRGALAVQLAPGQVLNCVVEPTELGKLAVGWVGPEKTAELRFEAVGRALRTTFSIEENEQ